MATLSSSATQLSGSPAAEVLSPGEIARLKECFAETGFLIFRGAVAKEKVSSLANEIIDEFERLRRSAQLFSGGGIISGHVNCFPGEQSRFIYQTLEERGIVQVVQAVLERPFGPPYAGCNLNLPGSVAQHYHADGLFTREFIVANVAAVDTDLENGAIDVLTGTQKKFYPYWRFVLERADRRSTRVPLQRGDVLLRSSNLWHRGMPNRTVATRPMFSLTFGEDRGPPPPDPFRINDGKVSFQPNWYRTGAMGRLRERIFVAAPFTYGAWRFARSLVGNKGYASW